MKADRGEAREGRFSVLLTCSLVSSLIMLDSNIVAVSLPAIGRSLGASFAEIEWVISAYVLTYAALLLASGNFADLRGRKLSMVIGLVIFGVASIACGLAPGALTLNLARAAQGVGGAFLLTASLAIISHEFSGDQRTGAFAFWGASLGIALAGGPVVGGAITHFFGWRWVFLVNVPLSAGLIAATFKYIDESRDPTAKGLDWPGIITFSLGLAVLIWALIDGNDAGWGSMGIVVRLAAATLLFAAFVAAELRRDHPMVDFALFRNSTFLGGVLAMIGYGASAQVMVFFLPQFLQNAYGYSPLTAGLAMIPFAIPMVLVPRASARLGAAYSGRALLTGGLVVSLAGNIAFWLSARVGAPYPVFLVGMVIAGCGAGLLNGQTVKVLQGAVPADRAGMGSGIASTTRFIGILVSVAGLGAVLANVVRGQFRAVAIANGLTPEAADTAARHVTSGDLAAAVAMAPAGARETLRAAGLMAFSHGFGAASAIAAVVAVVAAFLAHRFVSADDTRPTPIAHVPCKLVDCRHPL
ncbi:MAG: drug resistance transporter, EmrB/QacA subfamily [Bradyrhizobium sp.]|nr:drug resistance transporter, EmrB/QacA subfamily [Bradyrhizobium sp.]